MHAFALRGFVSVSWAFLFYKSIGFFLDFLTTIHPEYLAVGQSAVDINKDVLVGRPKWGTGILCNRKLTKYVTHVKVTRKPS